MGLSHSPRIVTDGLVLCLDAANIKSYPGSGTTWTDLSSIRNNGTLTSGPTYSSDNGGSFVFDGVDDHIFSFPSRIIGNGSKTISFFFKTSITSRQSLCEVRNNSTSNGWVFLINRTTAGNLSYLPIGAGTVGIERAAGITTNVWYNACATFDEATTTAILYLNGMQVGNAVTNATIGTDLAGYNGSIAKPDAPALSVYFQGSIAQASIYNRALSSAEIQQNFNALRGRFGI